MTVEKTPKHQHTLFCLVGEKCMHARNMQTQAHVEMVPTRGIEYPRAFFRRLLLPPFVVVSFLFEPLVTTIKIKHLLFFLFQYDSLPLCFFQ